MKLSEQEFKNITKTIKTDYGIKLETITPICKYGQSVLDNEKKYSIDDYAKHYYKMYLQDMEGYKKIDRESEIENLIMWISETKSENDKELMKEDLKYLMNLDCEEIFSSESTNEYIPIIN